MPTTGAPSATRADEESIWAGGSAAYGKKKGWERGLVHERGRQVAAFGWKNGWCARAAATKAEATPCTGMRSAGSGSEAVPVDVAPTLETAEKRWISTHAARSATPMAPRWGAEAVCRSIDRVDFARKKWATSWKQMIFFWTYRCPRA